MTPSSSVSRTRLLAAFAAVYLIWGSTYLAIRFAIETIPPFMMVAVRYLVAGVLVYAYARARGAPRPTVGHWKAAAVVGVLLLLGGNGGVVWAEQVVPSGTTALIVATEPLWIAMLLWLGTRERPSPSVAFGLLLGFGGVLFLVGPENLAGGERVHPIGALVIVLAALSWALGSLYSRGAPLPASQTLSTGMSMLAGGVALTVMSLATGEAARLDLAGISTRSTLALVYLIVFGSLVGFSAYLWLMKATTPSRASTYAYVNPVVAVFLGWLLAGEPLTPRTLIAAAVIVGAVAIIVARQEKRRQAPPAVVCETANGERRAA
jgi:drug/metabolite transporter (DMT)-like permease